MRSGRKLVVIAVTVPIGFVALIIVLLVMGIPEVRVENDLGVDVTLRGCVEWQRIPAHGHDGVRPSVPCRVYEIHGNLETYLGCLQIREGAFEGDPTKVSSLDATIGSDACESLDSYRDHARVRRVLSWVRGWF